MIAQNGREVLRGALLLRNFQQPRPNHLTSKDEEDKNYALLEPLALDFSEETSSGPRPSKNSDRRDEDLR